MAEMSMLEKVARAIHAKRRRPDDNKHWFHENPERCELSRQLARAAIEAMREPTREMIAAGKRASCADDVYLTVDEVDTIHRAMIDTALSEHAEINTAGSATNSSGGGE